MRFSKARMSVSAYDFAIFGNEPLAYLVAGLMAGSHRRSVVLIPGQSGNFGLPRDFDVSVGSITRPQTWALLQTGVPETAKLLRRLGGRTALRRIDPMMVADTAAGAQALCYLEHVARGFGHNLERLAGKKPGEGRYAVQFRDALLLDRGVLVPALERWVRDAGVRLVDGPSRAVFDPSGGGAIEADQTLAATRAILVGSAAFLEHDQRASPLLKTVTATAVLTEPTAPMLAPLVHLIDTGVVLAQMRNKAIAGVANGTLSQALPQIDRLLTDHRQLRLAGRSENRRVQSADGAPVVGRMGAGPELIVGNDPTMAFLAPALARWLAGSANAAEQSYFESHGARDPATSTVADYQADVA